MDVVPTPNNIMTFMTTMTIQKEVVCSIDKKKRFDDCEEYDDAYNEERRATRKKKKVRRRVTS